MAAKSCVEGSATEKIAVHSKGNVKRMGTSDFCAGDSFAMRRRLLCMARPTLLVLAVWGEPSIALADPSAPTDEERATARALGTEGVQMAASGDCRNAVDKLSRAEALVHAPTTALPLAQCEIQLGKVIAGTEILNRLVNETLAPNAPPSWIDSKHRAQAILGPAQMRIAKLKIHVDPAVGAPGPVIVMVDGVPLPPALLDADRLTDPGGHHVSARQGALSADTDVQLGDGQALSVSLALGAGPGAADRGAASPTAGFGQAQPAPNQPYPPQGGDYPPAPGAAPPAGGPPQGPSPGQEASPSAPAGEFTGLALGVRLGVGLPLGDATGAAADGLSSIISAEVPVWFDAGYRFTPNWFLGAYFMYGFGFLGSGATDTNGAIAVALGAPCGQLSLSCSIHDMRAGIDAAFHILPEGRLDPWLGLGVGYEWLGGNISYVDVNNVNQSFGVGDKGWEFVNIQAGLDIKKVFPNLGFGPFAALTFSEYSSAEVPSGNQTTGIISSSSVSVQNTSLHEWLMFGVRGEYDIQL
jgi:hypothetical protein